MRRVLVLALVAVAALGAAALDAPASTHAPAPSGEARAESSARSCGRMQTRYELMRITTVNLHCARGRRMIRRYLRDSRQRRPTGHFCHSAGMGTGALICEKRGSRVTATAIS